MISGRFWPRAAAATVALLTVGCNDAPPCGKNCPAIEGTYTLGFQQEDGGLGTDCDALRVELPQGPLSIIRRDSNLSATLDAVVLNGTVYASNDFTLAGGGAVADGGSAGETASFSLSGNFLPGRGGGTTGGDGGTSGDGGTPAVDGGAAQLSGNFFGTWSSTGADARRCTVNRPFTGTRQ